MTHTLQSSVGTAIRDTVPFLVITVIWIVVMLAVYGLFLLAKPAEATYAAAIHASVFVPPGTYVAPRANTTNRTSTLMM